MPKAKAKQIALNYEGKIMKTLTKEQVTGLGKGIINSINANKQNIIKKIAEIDQKILLSANEIETMELKQKKAKLLDNAGKPLTGHFARTVPSPYKYLQDVFDATDIESYKFIEEIAPQAGFVVSKSKYGSIFHLKADFVPYVKSDKSKDKYSTFK